MKTNCHEDEDCSYSRSHANSYFPFSILFLSGTYNLIFKESYDFPLSRQNLFFTRNNR